MQPLSTAMLEKALTISSQEKLMELGKALLTLVEEGQVLVYFNDPEVEAMLYDYGLDGAVRPGEGDYLYLVDSNVGFNKTDALIQRELAYQVDLSDIQHPMAQVRLDYQNMASEDVPCRQTAKGSGGTYQALQQSCYLDYWRVYVPGGSEFIGSTAQPVPGEELLSGEEWDGKVESLDGEGGTRVFAGLVMVPIGKSSQIITSYQLPGQIIKSISAEEMEYVIRVQVQPGIDGLPFQVEIKIPEHTNVIDQAAGWQLTGARTWTWQGVLHQATALSLTMQISR